MHPAISLAQHRHQLFFKLVPTIVAPQQKCRDCFPKFSGAVVNFSQRSAGGFPVKVFRQVGDRQAVTQAGEQGLLQCQLAAEGVDGRDAQKGRLVEQVPAFCLSVLESGNRQRIGVGVAGCSLGKRFENPMTHLSGGGDGESDGDDLPRFVHLGQQGKITLGQQCGFS